MCRLTLIAVALLALAACSNAASESDPSPTPGADSQATVAPTPAFSPDATLSLEARFSPVVLSHRGLNHLIEGQEITSAGFEFVLGARREDLEQMEGVVVHMPDGRDIALNPSTDLGVPLDFFNYYGTSEGLPPAGAYVFEITMKDGTIYNVENEYDGSVLPLPTNVQVDIDREAGVIDVTWDPIEDVKNYTVDVQDIQPDTSYIFAGAGCPDPDDVDPDHLDASYLTEAHCRIEGLDDLLVPGKRYGIQIAVWGYTSYVGFDGAVVFIW